MDWAIVGLLSPDLSRPDLLSPDLARPNLLSPDLLRPDFSRPDVLYVYHCGHVLFSPTSVNFVKIFEIYLVTKSL
jgi:hypothetical protein